MPARTRSLPPSAPDSAAPPTERALQETEERFRWLVESVKDYAIFSLDTTGHVTSWNPGAERIKGYAADEIIGKHFSVFYPEEDVRAGKCERELVAARVEGRFEDHGWRLRRDGSRFWADVTITPLRDPSGTLVGYAKVTRDMTEHRRAEHERLRLAQAEEANRVKDEYLAREQAARRAVEEARSALAATLRSIGDGVITTDADGRVALMNPVAERLTGWSEDEGRGELLRRVFRIVHEETRREVESPVDRVLRDGTVVGLANHTLLIKRSGEETPVADSGAPIRGGDAQVLGVVLVFRDASVDRRAELERAFLVEIASVLASSLDYKETLARVARMVVPSFADWCVVDVVEEGASTPVQVAVAHKDPDKVAMAHTWATRYPQPTDASRGAKNVMRTGRSELYPDIPDELLAKGATSEEHLELLRSLRLRSAVVIPIADREKVRGAMTLVWSDSGRKYTEADVVFLEEVGRRAGMAIENARLYTSEQAAREAADSANRTKDEFLATVSHELRTPLNAILGWSTMLEGMGHDAAKRARATETIRRNAEAMVKLIEDLLDVSRIISGKLRLDVTSLDVLPLVEAALESVRPAADAKELRFRDELQPSEGLVLGDAARLQQVVWNLLSNAVKFTPRGGEVVVSVRRDDAAVEIVVRDSGQGISPQFLPHVFEPFRQAEGGLSRQSGGLGLGLSITRHLVELHGGRIFASSEGEGKGATFVVRIPLMRAASERRARTATASGASPWSAPVRLDGLTVLSVDDDADARDLLRVVLEDAGARAVVVGSAEEAMKAIEGQVPDVLLSDIAMPGENGYDLIRRVRALPPDRGGDVPAAALTAYARAEDRQRVLAAGYMMHVPKPLDPAELVMVVATLARYQTKPPGTAGTERRA